MNNNNDDVTWDIPTWFRLSPNVSTKLRQMAGALANAETVLQILANLQLAGGSPIAMGMTIASTVGRIIRVTVPASDVVEQLISTGYTYKDFGILTKTLVKILSNEHAVTIEGNGYSVRVYSKCGVAIRTYGGRDDGVDIYVNNIETVYSTIQNNIWSNGNTAYSLTVKEDAYHNTMRMEPIYMDDLPVYIGRPSVLDIVDRIRTNKRNTKSICFYGPSGSGKSLLSKHLCKAICPDGDMRVLKFSTQSFESWDINSISMVVEATKPNVILIDDIQKYISDTRIHSNFDVFIELMEGLYNMGTEHGFTIIGTAMDMWPFREGMRPGRIDMWIPTRYPNSDTIDEIFMVYCGRTYDYLADTCIEIGNISTAYIVELAKRVLDGRSWRKELIDISTPMSSNMAYVYLPHIRNSYRIPICSNTIRNMLLYSEYIDIGQLINETMYTLYRHVLHNSSQDIRDAIHEWVYNPGVFDFDSIALSLTKGGELDDSMSAMIAASKAEMSEVFSDDKPGWRAMAMAIVRKVLNKVLGPGWAMDPCIKLDNIPDDFLGGK